VRLAAAKAFGRIALREPMVLFALIGAAIFALAALTGDMRADRRIRIGAAEIAQLEAYWQAQAQRAPSEQELAGLIEDRVTEEVLAREALRLGLDRDDVIIRRRLAQKLAFLNDDLAEAAEPSEAQLRAFFAANAARYAAAQSVSFEHVFFSPDRRGARLDADLQATLGDLQEERAGAAAPADAGDPFMLARAYQDAPLGEIARDYGRAFAEALAAGPVGQWTGPVGSALGAHIVRVNARQGAVAPPFETVVARVAADWRAEERRAANAAWIARLRARYEIVVDRTATPP
jgi:parvulin-like peptidyl-prolyl isomerase